MLTLIGLASESSAICRYVLEKYTDRGNRYLLGRDSLEKSSVEQWLKSEEQSFDPPRWALVFHFAFPPSASFLDPERPLMITENERRLAKVLDVYEQRLSGSRYLAGNEFSLADLSHYPNSHYLARSKEWGYLFESRKHVSRWWSRTSNRPSWKETVKILDEVGILKKLSPSITEGEVAVEFRPRSPPSTKKPPFRLEHFRRESPQSTIGYFDPKQQEATLIVESSAPEAATPTSWADSRLAQPSSTTPSSSPTSQTDSPQVQPKSQLGQSITQPATDDSMTRKQAQPPCSTTTSPVGSKAQQDPKTKPTSQTNLTDHSAIILASSDPNSNAQKGTSSPRSDLTASSAAQSEFTTQPPSTRQRLPDTQPVIKEELTATSSQWAPADTKFVPTPDAESRSQPAGTQFTPPDAESRSQPAGTQFTPPDAESRSQPAGTQSTPQPSPNAYMPVESKPAAPRHTSGGTQPTQEQNQNIEPNGQPDITATTTQRATDAAARSSSLSTLK